MSPEENPSWRALTEFIEAQTGLTFPLARFADVQERIRRAMRQVDIQNPHAYLNFLRSSSDAFKDLIADITVGETYFFRHAAQFEFLRREVLPQLRERNMGVRLWSAACSSGEEAYSLAILTEQAGLASRTRILATDISERALHRARQGIYSEWSLREAGADLISSWFVRQERRFHLAEGIRRRVEFNRLNLALDAYPSTLTGTWSTDVIFCRNVLIYFDRATIARVAKRLFDSLAEGGWLITAPADPPLNEVAGFEVVTTSAGVFYRRPVGIERLPASLEAAAIEEDPFQAPPEPKVEMEVDPHSLALDVRRIANSGDWPGAEVAAADATRRCPLSAEIHFVRALVLAGLGNREAAAVAVRRAIYLDGSLALAHFTLGAILQASGDWDGARRAYGNARKLAGSQPEDQPLPLGEGEKAGNLARAAASRIQDLEAAAVRRS
jgi:chemotaxis protein methyltransferase CheR